MKKLCLIACTALSTLSLWANEEMTLPQDPAMVSESLPAPIAAEILPEETEKQAPAPLATEYEIQVYQKEAVLPLLPILNEWTSKSFAPFPYLYAAPNDQVASLCDYVFVNERNSLVLVAKKEGRIVAVAGASALDSPYLNQYYFQSPVSEGFLSKGYAPSDYLYVSYFLVAPEFRGDLSLIQPMYDALAQFGKNSGKSRIAYMSVHTAENPLLRPDVFSSAEPWGTAIAGFDGMDFFIEEEWPTFQPDGSILDQKHTLQFYSKPL
jgi:hypothetical protein